MESFENHVENIKAELKLRGMEHSSLIYNSLVQVYYPYYKSADAQKRSLLLARLRRLEKECGTQNPFDWEAALS